MHPSTATRARRAGLPAVALVALVISLAGCGSGSSSNGVASLGSSGSTTSTATPAGSSSSAPTANSNQLVKYSQCMRANGVPNFPDPSGGRLTIRGGPGTGLNPSSPAFQDAQRKCKSLQPSGIGSNPGASAQLQTKGLQFSQCMRTHGVPNFPDPTFSGAGMRLQLKSNIDPNSPAFKKAQQACQSVLPGGAP